MYSLLLLAALGALTIRIFFRTDEKPDLILSSKLGGRLEKLWEIAHQGIVEQKYLRAEKALLTILRVDERNATAYNRLGILYTKQRAYADAIECFEIAQSLEPSASSLHNVGLIYYETGQFDKALNYHNRVLALYKKLGNQKDIADSLINLGNVYDDLGQFDKALNHLRNEMKKVNQAASTD